MPRRKSVVHPTFVPDEWQRGTHVAVEVVSRRGREEFVIKLCRPEDVGVPNTEFDTYVIHDVILALMLRMDGIAKDFLNKIFILN